MPHYLQACSALCQVGNKLCKACQLLLLQLQLLQNLLLPFA